MKSFKNIMAKIITKNFGEWQTFGGNLKKVVNFINFLRFKGNFEQICKNWWKFD